MMNNAVMNVGVEVFCVDIIFAVLVGIPMPWMAGSDCFPKCQFQMSQSSLFFSNISSIFVR